MNKLTKLICIACPVGCFLEVFHQNGQIEKIEGNKCKMGLKYADNELNNPTRFVTTTVRIKGGIHPLLPVHLSAPIPKKLIFNLMEELRKIELKAPVYYGEVIVENVLRTGVKVLASRDLLEDKDLLYSKQNERKR